MSPATSQAKVWTCDRCAVSAGRIDGEAMPLPPVWESSAEGRFCLTCRRERAAEAALESAPSGSPVDARAKLRRAALIEFEVARTPEHPDGTIARACHTSVVAVTHARRRLNLPDPSTPKAGRTARRATSSR
jgi:hypothetical protein